MPEKKRVTKKKARKAPRLKASPLTGGLDFITGYPKNNSLLVEELGKLRTRILEDKTSQAQMGEVSRLLKSFPS
jgi:hypothetical protein